MEGGVSLLGVGARAVAPNGPRAIAMMVVEGDGTLRVVYKATCCAVGRIMAPVNPLITLAPYLAVICLMATAAMAVKRKSLRI